jgi:hypothetical protein
MSGGGSGKHVLLAQKPGKATRAARRRWPLCLAIVLMLDILLAAGALGVAARAVRAPLQTVQVAAGPEDEPFFTNQQVQAEFARNGLRIVLTYDGSGVMATTLDLRGYDAVFPSSSVLAAEVQQRLSQAVHPVTPFSTQLVVLTSQEFIPRLRQLGIVDQNGTFDVGRYLTAASEGATWSSLRGDDSDLNPDPVQLDVANPQYSNSGAMFVAEASYALNRHRVVPGPGEVKPIAEQIATLLSPLGELLGTSGLFSQYLTGAQPMVIGYESDFLGEELTNPAALPPGADMLYLDTPIECEHTILPLTDSGAKFAALMQNDPVLQSIAENDYGFRIGGSSASFAQAMARHKITLPPGYSTDYSINAPTAAVLEDLVKAIGPQLQS